MDVNGVCTININNNACCFGSCCECLVAPPPSAVTEILMVWYTFNNCVVPDRSW